MSLESYGEYTHAKGIVVVEAMPLATVVRSISGPNVPRSCRRHLD